MLRRILLFARRDYVAAVFTKSFLFGLLLPVLIPLGLMIFSGGVATVVRSTSVARHVALLDHTGVDAATSILRPEKQPVPARRSRRSSPYDSDIVFEAAGETDRATLLARVRKGELFGLLELESIERATLHTLSGAGGMAYAEIQSALDRGLREVKLRQSGLDPVRFAEVLKPVPIELKGIDSRKESLAQSMVKSMVIPAALMLVMLITVVNACMGMLGGVAEDKKERVFEMLLASATPLEIMAGKVVGSMAVALTSSLAWILYALAGLLLTGTLGLAPLHLLPWLILYLTCQLLMLSALGAAIGAAAATPAEAQRFSTVLLLPLALPVFMLGPLVDQPQAIWAVALSLLPPVAPIVMMVRQAGPVGVPFWQPWLAAAVMLASTFVLTWIASRIFRVGLLAQGHTRWVDLARWALRG